MNPHDVIIMRVLAARVEATETGNQHLQLENQRLQAMLEEGQKRIAELEAKANGFQSAA